MPTKCQQNKREIWSHVPNELIRQMIGEWPQELVMKITGEKIPGFRAGKVPPKMLEERVLRKYEKFPGVRENLQEAVNFNIEEVHEAVKKVQINRLSEKIPELIKEYGKTKLFLAIFLDNRKGIRTLGRTLWENFSELTEETAASLETSNFNHDTVTNDKDHMKKKSSLVSKLKKSLQKAEKNIKSIKDQHRKIVSDRDKKIFEQKKRLVELEKQVMAKDKEVGSVNDRLLENKKQIAKLEGALSSMSGQLRKLNQLRDDDALIIKELNDELKALKKSTGEREVSAQTEAEVPENIAFVVSARGEFIYNSPEGFVLSEQGVINVPEDLIAKHQLVSGDLVELEMGGSRHDSCEVKIIQKVESRELAGFIVYEGNDYWVKCGTEKIFLGLEEVFRAGASEGDPVSVLVPSNKSNAKGRITKIHWVSLVRDITANPDRPKRIEKTVKKTVFDNTLSGVKILVLGGDGVKNSYIRELQQMGGEVEWHTGFNEMHAIPHKVGRADVVLVLTAHMSHKVYYVLKTAAKAYHKQPLYYSGLSIKGAAMAVAGFCQKYKELDLIS